MAINKEQGLITEILVSGDIVTVVDSSINSSYFSGRYKKAFRYIQEHQSKYGKLPTIDTFLQKNPNFELGMIEDKYGTGESVKFWCDEVRAKKKHNTIAEVIENVVSLINDKLDTDGAYEELKKLILKVENEIVFSDRIKVNENTQKRKEEYKKRQKSGGMTGIPSFLTHWDNLLGGYNNGELYTYMGYTGVGKSWLEIIQAVAQAKAGYRVLFITTEMSDKLVFRRIDAVWCGLNYSDFKKGQLKPDQEKKYFKYLDDMENTSDDDVMLVVEQATGGLSQISAKIDQYNPDIVYVDGAYLLEDEEGEEDNWAGVTRIWRGFHRLCLAKDKPIVLTTQSKDETGATLKSMAFAKAIANECDVVGVIEQDEQMKNDKEAKLRPLKLREGDSLSNVTLQWDFDKMLYNSIFKEKAVEQTKVENVQGVITIS